MLLRDNYDTPSMFVKKDAQRRRKIIQIKTTKSLSILNCDVGSRGLGKLRHACLPGEAGAPNRAKREATLLLAAQLQGKATLLHVT